MAMGRSYRIYQRTVEGSPFSLIMENTRSTDEFLLFESGVVASLLSADCEEFKRQYVKVLDAYGCLGVLQQNEGEHVRSYLVLVTACVSVGKVGECDVYRVTGCHFLPMWASALAASGTLAVDERMAEIQKFISAGTFYFSWAAKPESYVDLSLCAQRRADGCASDSRFFWNRTLHLHLQRFGIDTGRWLLRVLCGGVEIKTVYVGHKTAKACVVSRLSCERAGTRFNVRGTNDYGHVANFVETEQVIFLDDDAVSFVQTRGSVPLFWEQPGVQVGSHKVKMSRGFEASAPAYDRHFRHVISQYGEQVVVNLLGNKEGEKALSQFFRMHHENSSHCDSVPYIEFDYHSVVRAPNKPQNVLQLWEKIGKYVEKFGFFHSRGGEVLRRQTGTIRTNCLDCLDRTNCVQSYIGLRVLSSQLAALELLDKQNMLGRFDELFRQIWVQNGDHVSKIYAGTGALDGRSKIKDASRSVTRTIQNNLMDGSKQEAIDIFLLGSGLNTDLYDRACNLLPTSLLNACPNVLASVIDEAKSFTMPQTMRVFCGTWNVNGGQRFNSVAFRNQSSMADWLLDLPIKSAAQLVDLVHDYSTPIDIFAIGLEEIVDLNASNIMSASSTNQKIWSDELKKILSRDHKYILITSVQLVGVCLYVFVRPHLAPYIRDVGTDSVKTGMGGATGNKGGVAIRFVLHATTFCFVCAHFAAGQSNVVERNNDFLEISRRIQFPMGRNLYSHDYVFWFGDFNYRIDLTNEDTKTHVRDRNWEALLAADQLTVQRVAGHTFVGFQEGKVAFAPTYKYDTFSDDYDTSEKARNPAWTDRILFYQRPPRQQRGANDESPKCRLLFYNRAELKTSDHRPVGALFDVEVLEINEAKREETYQSVVACMGPPDSTVLISVAGQVAGSGFRMDLLDGILAKVAELGIRVLLVKFVGDDMWLIFLDGEMALAALSMDGVSVGDATLNVRLRSPNWEEESATELQNCRRDTATLFSNANYSLLGEEVNVSGQTPDEVGGDADDETEAELMSSTLLQVGGTGGLTSAAGQRPASNPPSGRSTPTVPESKKAPPPRPGPPPPRPAPIQPRTTGPTPAAAMHKSPSADLLAAELGNNLDLVKVREYGPFFGSAEPEVNPKIMANHFSAAPPQAERTLPLGNIPPPRPERFSSNSPSKTSPPGGIRAATPQSPGDAEWNSILSGRSVGSNSTFYVDPIANASMQAPTSDPTRFSPEIPRDPWNDSAQGQLSSSNQASTFFVASNNNRPAVSSSAVNANISAATGKPVENRPLPKVPPRPSKPT